MFRNLSLYLIALGLFSCAEYKYVGIQTLNPSPIVIPRNFTKPLVVFSYYEGIKGERESMAKASFDSVAGSEAAETLINALSDSPWFGNLNIRYTHFIRKDVSPYINPFPWDTVQSICMADTADLLISLEYINVRPVVDSYNFYDEYTKYYFGSITNYIYAFWRVYDLSSKKIYGSYLFKDTIVWEKVDLIPVAPGRQLPALFLTAAYSGYLTGQKYASQIAPSWSDEKRIVYTDSRELKKALKHVNQNNWLSAAKVWQEAYSNKGIKPEIAAKSAFNMALANEMYGNFDVSLEWLNKSKELWFLPYEAIYRELIIERIQKTQLLLSK